MHSIPFIWMLLNRTMWMLDEHNLTYNGWVNIYWADALEKWKKSHRRKMKKWKLLEFLSPPRIN